MITKESDMHEDRLQGVRGGCGEVVFRHYFLKQDFTSGIRLCCKVIIPPGGSIGLHRHEQEDEIYIVTEGTGLLSNGQQEIPIEQGDSVLTGDGQEHAVANTGSGNLQFIAVISVY